MQWQTIAAAVAEKWLATPGTQAAKPRKCAGYWAG